MATLHATLPDSATTNITIGNNLTDAGIVVDYSCARGALYQAGRMRVVNKVTTAEVLHQWFGDDTGLDDFATPLTADILGNNIRLNITVNGDSVNDVVFNYNLAIIEL